MTNYVDFLRRSSNLASMAFMVNYLCCRLGSAFACEFGDEGRKELFNCASISQR